MKSIKEIFGIRKEGNISFNNPERQSPEAIQDYSVKKAIDTQEFKISGGVPGVAPGFLKNDVFGVVTTDNDIVKADLPNPLIVDKIGIGVASPTQVLEVAGQGLFTGSSAGVEIQRNNSYPTQTLKSGSATSYQAPYFLMYHHDGSIASPTYTKSGFELGHFGWRGYGDTALTNNACRLTANAEGDFTDTSTPGNFSFYTCPTGSVTLGERLKITAAGNVVIGSAAIATNATDKFLYIPSCAGTPTGVPTAYSGRLAMVYDSTNNKLYIYNGAWKSATFA